MNQLGQDIIRSISYNILIGYILKPCKTRSQPEENKVPAFSKTRRRIPKNNKKWKIGEIEIDEAIRYKCLGVT